MYKNSVNCMHEQVKVVARDNRYTRLCWPYM